MKVLTIISLLSSLLNINIKSDYIANVTNNTGNSSYANIAQLTYWYTSDDSNYEIELSAPDLLGITSIYQQTYTINININFRLAVDQAHMTFKLPTPRNTTHTANFNIISENAYVLSNFSDTIDVTAYNTDFVHIKLIFSWEQLEEYYGLSRNLAMAEDPDVNYWATNGNLHVYVSQFQVDSVTLSTSPNYNTQLNSLISNTDTIETLLNSLITQSTLTNTKLDTISSNISSINTLLSTIDSRLVSIMYQDQNYNTALYQIDNIVKYPNSIFSENYYQITPITNPSGTGPSGQYFNTVIYNRNDDNYAGFNEKKLKFVLEVKGTLANKFYYINLPDVSNISGPSQTYTYTLYVPNTYQSNVIVIYISLTCSTGYISARMWTKTFTIGNPTQQGGTPTMTSNINSLYTTDSPIYDSEVIYNIMESLNNLSDINVSEDPNENTLSNFYETLKQNLQLPTVPEGDSNILKKMKKITDPVIRMFNLGELDVFKYMFNFGVLAMLFGVIFL